MLAWERNNISHAHGRIRNKPITIKLERANCSFSNPDHAVTSGNPGAGCGIGSHTLLLAEAVTPAAHITGLDLSPEQVAYAREAAKESGLSKHISFREGDMNNLQDYFAFFTYSLFSGKVPI